MSLVGYQTSTSAELASWAAKATGEEKLLDLRKVKLYARRRRVA